MDLFNEIKKEIIITPKNYIVNFKKLESINNHYAVIGIGMIQDNFPLYYDAINEYGLGFVALNFPNYCKYYKYRSKYINLAPFELGLYLLINFKSINEIKNIIKNINLCNIDFSKDLKNTPLHFMISDQKETIVIEPTLEGFKIYDNPFDILTNSPPFSYHKTNLLNYINLTNKDIKNNLNPSLNFTHYSHGMGAIGLPGDFSSTSRFIKGYFVKSFLDLSIDNVLQSFKCLDSISMIKGCVQVNDLYEYTVYSSLYDLKKGILYYKTYLNPIIKSRNIYDYDINSSFLINEKL